MGFHNELSILLDESGIDWNAYFGIQNRADNTLPVKDAIAIVQAGYVLHEAWGQFDIALSDSDLDAAWLLYPSRRHVLEILAEAFVSQYATEKEAEVAV